MPETYTEQARKTAFDLEEMITRDIDGLRKFPVEAVTDVNGVAYAYFTHTHPSVLNTVGIKTQELVNLGYRDIRPGTWVWFSISGHGLCMNLLEGEELQNARA